MTFKSVAGLELLEPHLKELRASGLSDETIREAGLYSVTEKWVIVQLGYSHLTNFLPVLAFPLLTVDRERVNQNEVRIKPDRPRSDGKGKPIKYESKRNTQNRLYVPDLALQGKDDPSTLLYITEGEKKALKACQEGLPAVALAGVWCFLARDKTTGLSSIIPDFDHIVWQDRQVYIVFDSDLEDNDKIAQAERRLANELQRRGAIIKAIRLPSGSNGEKIGLDDYLVSHSVEQFKDLPVVGIGMKPQLIKSAWPAPLPKEAYHGLAGDIVNAIAPHSEADPVAILGQFLVAYGNVVGRSPHFVAEADRHGANLFITLVGETAKGRKGTSWGHIRRLFEKVDNVWSENCINHGLSSGEGLVWAVRDPIEKTEPIRENKRVVDYETVVIDHGVEDKRLLVYESELSSTLRVMGRDGNNLSAIIRNSWDTGDLRTMTKNSPARATGAHISVIGHITRDELLRYLNTTEMGNGFANRFLWLCVKRSKILPEGSKIQDVDLMPLVRRLKKAIEFAPTVGEIKRTNEARTIWRNVYPKLSEGQLGLVGAVIARAEAQVMRVASTYALLDCSAAIRREHLLAGLALWDYAEASAKYIFGASLGDPAADKILDALRSSEQGLNKTDIHALFGRNKRGSEIDRALSVLEARGLAQKAIEAGIAARPIDRWLFVT